MIGRTVAQYEVQSRLGSGGMGDVYRALDKVLGRHVALKVLPPKLAANRRRIERFRREARALAALNHPSIVTVYAITEVDGLHLLSMELVEGQTLNDLIGKEGIGLSRFFDIAGPLADALATAHEGGVIHRDLKPSNVMVTKSGQVKVLDFGLAKLKASPRSGLDTQLPTEVLTVEGHLLGTVPYMAPEQVQGRPADERSDIFSIGVLLYEMATGERPFKGANSVELAAAILHKQPAEVDERKANIPHHLARIIRHCLEKDPERRIQSAKDLRNALEDLRRELTTTERALVPQALSGSSERPAEAPSSAAPPPARWRRLPALVGALAVVLTLAVLLWRAGGGGQDSAARHPVGDEAQALLDQGHLFELRGLTDENLAQAEDRYRRALRLDPDNPVIQGRLAAYLAAVQRHEPAAERPVEIRRLTDEALEAEPELVDGWIARGRLALFEEDLPGALRAADRAIESASEDYRGYTLLGEALIEEGRVDEGFRQLRRGTELAGPDTRARLALASLLWEKGRTDQAIVAYREVLDYVPDSPSALNNLGIIFGQQGRYLDAIPLLKRLLTVARDVDAAINLAVCYFYLDRTEDAIAAYHQALEIEPGHPWATHGLAEAYDKLGDKPAARRWFEASIAAYDEKLAAGGGRPRLLGLRAVCAAKLGRFDEALAAIAEAESLDPDNMDILFNAAQVNALSGRREAMLESMRRAIEAGYQRKEFESDLSFRPFLDDPGFRSVLESVAGA